MKCSCILGILYLYCSRVLFKSPSLNSLSSKCPLVCDRSVSTSEDEGVYSFDGSDDNSDHSEQRKVKNTVYHKEIQYSCTVEESFRSFLWTI